MVNHTIAPDELAVEDREWMDLLQCIKGHKEPLGDNPNAEKFQLLLLDLSKAFLTVLCKGTTKDMRSDLASIIECLDGLVGCFLKLDPLSWTAIQEHCFSLLSFITWLTYSRGMNGELLAILLMLMGRPGLDISLREPPQHRVLILNVLERFTLSPAIVRLGPRTRWDCTYALPWYRSPAP